MRRFGIHAIIVTLLCLVIAFFSSSCILSPSSSTQESNVGINNGTINNIIINYAENDTSDNTGSTSDSSNVEHSSTTASSSETAEQSFSSAPLTLSAYMGSMSSLNRLSFQSAEASSWLKDCGGFPAESAIDGDDTTSWQEGVSGVGVGEYLKLYFSSDQSVSVLSLSIGHYGNNDQQYTYNANSRPKTLLFSFSDGSSASYTFKDTHDAQVIQLSHPVQTSYVFVEIQDAYDAEWPDTGISEIKAYQ